jgi:DNA-binding HxlR family transcriptional regulator
MHLPTAPGVLPQCGRINSVLSLVGDKWTVLIVMVLRQQPRRFNDLKRTVGGISQQMLTRTLKALERDGMVTRTVRATIPPQVEYALTGLGDSLAKPVQELGEWVEANVDAIELSRQSYALREKDEWR